MAAVRLANTAGLLLPVSNLTNLLAVGRLALPVTAYARMMGLPAPPGRRGHRGRFRARYDVPQVRRPAGPVLFIPRVRRCWWRPCAGGTDDQRCGGARAVAPGATGLGAAPRQQAAGLPGAGAGDAAPPAALAPARGRPRLRRPAVGLARRPALGQPLPRQPGAGRLVAVRLRRARPGAAPTRRERPAPVGGARCRSATAPQRGRRRTTAPRTGSTGRGASGRARSVAHRGQSAAAS